ncbi:dihydropteroate synthase [Porphyromonas sp.]|uniref:dihydropteroate synthase n=1 Tax=Porphyromonas sp. TaxID=1924944 RepID=UPI0026DB3603|nr:dihydropteroate synthase [Porphyromonas sp.]MDO4770866.1 dihydropteroate synthase [Porphyromonas sp.]
MNPNLLVNIRGRLLDLGERPVVMGILNHTPDSFYAGSRIRGKRAIHERIEQILAEGGEMIDVGGYSTRPDAVEVSPQEEWERVSMVLDVLRKDYPDVTVSVDTFRSEVARKAVEIGGVALVNDVSGGLLDNDMYRTVGELQVPYILMHMRGTPKTMQSLTEYEGKVTDVVISELLQPIRQAREAGIKDIILDPGFGFSKTLEQNYELMREMDKFAVLELPLLVGISRKSMIYRLLGTTPQEALNGTAILNTFALLHGAHILRVHDVREAVEAVKIVQMLKPQS